MKKYTLLLLVCLLGIPLLDAPARATSPADSLRLSVDYARFRGDDKNLYVEVYFGFPQKGLTYVQDSSGFDGGMDITLRVTRKDSIVFADRWIAPHAVKDTAILEKNMNLISISNMMLGPGEYVMHVIGRDRYNPQRADSIAMRVPIKMIDSEKIILSDLELSSMITRGSKGDPFYKNTLSVIPNASGIFGQDQRCYYYAETYNLLTGNDQSDYTVKASVYDGAGREVISRERPRKRHGESSVLVDNIDVEKLRSGTYTLILSITDTAKKTLTSSGKKFFVYNPVLGVDSTLLRLNPSISENVFATMSEYEMDREFQWATYEASREEKSQFDGLKGEEPKRKFLTDFWRRRPAGLRDECLKRVAYANNNYQVLGRQGYKTDRGRVYIVYGPPSDIERHPNESGTRPYQIWSYNNIQGGVIFVFVLRTDGGDYELVHSTHRNELHDANWIRYALTR